MKKLFIILLVASLILGLATGCASTSNKQMATSAETTKESFTQAATDDKGQEKPTSISVIVSNDLKPTIEYAAGVYKKMYGIDVEIISQAYDSTHDKITTAALGGGHDDVIYLDNPWSAEFSTNGLIIPLDDYIPAGLTEKFVNFDYLKYNGKTWGLPSLNEGKWLYYNTKMLADAGYKAPPKTWKELTEMSQKMISDGIAKHGIVWAGKQAEGLICDITHLFGSFGAQWIDDSGKFVFNSPEAVRALEFYRDSLNNGVADPASITYNDGEAINPFLAGDTPFAISWSFLWSVSNDPSQSKVAGKVAVGLIPGDEKSGVVSSSVSGSAGYGVLKNSDAQEWAYKFIELLTSEDVQVKQLEMIASLPVLKSLYKDENLIKKYPFLKESFEQLSYVNVRAQLPKYSEWSQEIQVYFHKAITGTMTPKQALDEAVAASAKFERGK